ncbi:bifunctional UDP-sugar hydrolase/5'-nucleotidase UshA [Candidatus Schmidhempelia bombi]|uniref:Bifunctional UDP-sugar hydrolase/5'-nucleotidase n=1 Tax=Candidatus Schmidhempelia bombi str. Bimp TaxID=1387197 RepID=A0AB94ID79_9GAMM|nr:bifunctional UDP-sugar hydrolase/5'-nucleotidase UshA [Candidatus Schmidhempelia bombi]TEA27379.1 bifunctional UDP-sugar hydrolase/5'-nucleotidase [Candidatus Schmidhempelia bombi str. Bimp]
MKSITRLCLGSLITISTLFPLSGLTWEKDKTYHLTILHTNDHHGHFWQNDIGEIGLAAQKTLVDRIRQEVTDNNGMVLLLSGGDINTGVPESDILQAKPDFLGMNLIGYDAMAVGNHEFDHDISVIRQQQQWANFPFLSANIYHKKTGERVFAPYAMFHQQQLNIAVIGLTTEDTPKVSDLQRTNDFDFKSVSAEAKKVIEELKQTQEPDIIIAVTHLGHYDNGQHGSNAPGDVSLARSLPEGNLDIIIGGHSQDPVCMAAQNKKQINYVPGTACLPDRQNGTWIMQAHEWGKYVGRADFTFLNGVLTLVDYQLIPINLKQEVELADGVKTLNYYTEAIPHNMEMLDLLTPYQKQGEQQLLTVIGQLNGRLDGDRQQVRYQQTNLAQLILASHIDKTQADVGVISGGMIRDSLIEGNISYRDILKVQPFANSVVYADLTGEQLIAYLTAAATKSTGSGGYAHFAQVSMTLKGDKLTDINVKGQPIDKQKTYRLVTQRFLAYGGDAYPPINHLPSFVDTGFMEAKVLKQYIEQHSPINADDYQPQAVITRY